LSTILANYRILRVLQVSVISFVPSHPPPPKTSFKHSLNARRVPPPHVREQTLHCPNALHVGQVLTLHAWNENWNFDSSYTV